MIAHRFELPAVAKISLGSQVKPLNAPLGQGASPSASSRADGSTIAGKATLGTQFAALDMGMPKGLLPLGGTPVIGHALAEAVRAGFEAAIVVLSPKKDRIREFLADNKPRKHLDKGCKV